MKLADMYFPIIYGLAFIFIIYLLFLILHTQSRPSTVVVYDTTPSLQEYNWYPWYGGYNWYSSWIPWNGRNHGNRHWRPHPPHHLLGGGGGRFGGGGRVGGGGGRR